MMQKQQSVEESRTTPSVHLDLIPAQSSSVEDERKNANFLMPSSNNIKIPTNNSLAPPTDRATTSSSLKCTKNIPNPKNVRLSSRSMQIGNLVRTKLYSSFPNLPNNVVRKDPLNSKWYNDVDENVNKVLKAVASDHVVTTPTEDNKIRRTVYIERRDDEKFGFIIQSYAFRRRNKIQMEQITYVDYVALDGPAFRAGLRAGDVILAINGKNIQNYSHKQLVRYIVDCKTLRMVVLFENCVNRIELCARAIKFKKLLSDKEFELKTLSLQEDRLLKGLPLFTEEEILTLLRTPCNSPTIERISNFSDVNSIISDALSSIGVVSSSDEQEERIEENNADADESNNLIVNDSIADDGGTDAVNFILGSDSSSASASLRSSVYSKHSSTQPHSTTTPTILENCSTTSETRSTTLDDIKIIQPGKNEESASSVDGDDATLDSRDNLRVDATHVNRL